MDVWVGGWVGGCLCICLGLHMRADRGNGTRERMNARAGMLAGWLAGSGFSARSAAIVKKVVLPLKSHLLGNSLSLSLTENSNIK